MSVFVFVVVWVCICVNWSVASTVRDGATSGTCGANVNWSYNETSHFIVFDGSGDMYSTYPSPWSHLMSEIEGFEMNGAITSIASYGFMGCPGLTSISIPDSVKSIGQYAFAGCNNLVLVEIPSSVTTIVSSAFQKCSKLSSVNISDSVKSIGELAFSDCVSLESFNIPKDLTKVDAAFVGCTGLKQFTVSPGNSAFMEVDGVLFSSGGGTLIQYPCGKSSHYDMPDNAYALNTDCFSGCTNLSSVVISSGVNAITQFAFNGCSGLESVIFRGNAITKIEAYAFSDCVSLESIDLPENVWDIQENAFFGCTSLKSIIIPGKVTQLKDSAFESCSSLTSVVLPEAIRTIGSKTFSKCTELTDISLPPGLTTLGASSFLNCTSLRSLVIPESVSQIGSMAFSGCSSLESGCSVIIVCVPLNYNASISTFCGIRVGRSYSCDVFGLENFCYKAEYDRERYDWVLVQRYDAARINCVEPRCDNKTGLVENHGFCRDTEVCVDNRCESSPPEEKARWSVVIEMKDLSYSQVNSIELAKTICILSNLEEKDFSFGFVIDEAGAVKSIILYVDGEGNANSIVSTMSKVIGNGCVDSEYGALCRAVKVAIKPKDLVFSAGMSLHDMSWMIPFFSLIAANIIAKSI